MDTTSKVIPSESNVQAKRLKIDSDSEDHDYEYENKYWSDDDDETPRRKYNKKHCEFIMKKHINKMNIEIDKNTKQK